MSDISFITPGGHGSMGFVNRLAAPTYHPNESVKQAGASDRSAHGSSRADRVELSTFAHFMAQMRQMPALSRDRVGEIQQAIRNGTYETPEKLDLAVERLIDEIG